MSDEEQVRPVPTLTTAPPYARVDITIGELFQILVTLRNWAIATRELISGCASDKPAPEPVPELPEVELLRAVSVGTLYATVRALQEARVRFDDVARNVLPRETDAIDAINRKALKSAMTIMEQAFLPPSEVRAQHESEQRQFSANHPFAAMMSSLLQGKEPTMPEGFMGLIMPDPEEKDDEEGQEQQ